MPICAAFQCSFAVSSNANKVMQTFSIVSHGWWFPEQAGPDHGIFESCANVLTDDNADLCDPTFGSSPLKGLLCRVYKTDVSAAA